jgi:hypothetical protein
LSVRNQAPIACRMQARASDGLQSRRNIPKGKIELERTKA